MIDMVVRVHENELFETECGFGVLEFAEINVAQLEPSFLVGLVDFEVIIEGFDVLFHLVL